MVIHIDEDGLSEVFEQIAAKIRKVDLELRSRLTGSDVKIIRPEAVQAFANIGVTLLDLEIDQYSRSISDNSEYRIILR